MGPDPVERAQLRRPKAGNDYVARGTPFLRTKLKDALPSPRDILRERTPPLVLDAFLALIK
jgi:hypothetical protein